MDRNTDLINRQLSNANSAVNQRLDSTAQLLRLLNKDLGQVHEIGQQMRDFQHFFRTPKIRGRLGEQIMEELLFQVLPRSVVSTQHRFQGGQIVDALIKIESGAIPVDAKFPLENYQKALNASTEDMAKSFHKEFKRDVKRHIYNISNKYILPAEGTLDFAVMYIPSNTLYYEILSDDALLQEAEGKNILCVSPNSFYYFLKLILAGLYSYKIEKTAAFIMQHISAFEQNVHDISNELNILLSHINNSSSAGVRVANRVQGLEKKLENLLLLDSDNREDENNN
ncbi:DNA recombination protein RmuC [candidate division KSB1 bacterium]|nr:DNA recombination protein RmuC [candidate division KSB1 bacterium]